MRATVEDVDAILRIGGHASASGQLMSLVILAQQSSAS